VKVPVAETWSCDECRTKRIRRFQEELPNARRQIEELQSRNRELEKQLQLAGAGKRDTAVKQKDTKCLVMGDSVLRNIGAKYPDMMVECFPELHSYTE
jgi:predicted RNase H-like nuclease (RuvC/YqgF family)